MTWRGKLGLISLGACLPLAILSGAVGYFYLAAAVRPTAPPDNAPATRPWGAVDFETIDTNDASGLQRTIADSFKAEAASDFDANRDGTKEYDLLALSGGGSYGAFGAGVLCGWTDRGNRPDFKVVTGVSTGSLQATSAFLGSAYDGLIKRLYTSITNDDIFEKRSLVGGLVADGTLDSAPLRRLLDTAIDDKVLAVVAEKHRRGRRLFVGTTNMDASDFVMWDMGAIAASGRPDARQRYIDVLVASCSVPVLFPPVYFDVTVNGKTYHEMHADGGAEAQVFFRGFMLDVEDALADAGISVSHVKARLFIIRNGYADVRRFYTAVQPSTVAIASATIEKLFKISASSSLYRIYVLANRYHMQFNLRCIPSDYDLTFDSLDFDAPGMKKLFDLGYRVGRDSDDWIKAPPGLDPDELVRAQNPTSAPAAPRSR